MPVDQNFFQGLNSNWCFYSIVKWRICSCCVKFQTFQGKASKVFWANVSSITMQADMVFDILQIISYNEHWRNHDLFDAGIVFLFLLPIILAAITAAGIIGAFYSEKCFPVATCCWDTSSFWKAVMSYLCSPFVFLLVLSSLVLTIGLCWAPLTILMTVPAVLAVYFTPLFKFLISWAWLFSGYAFSKQLNFVVKLQTKSLD